MIDKVKKLPCGREVPLIKQASGCKLVEINALLRAYLEKKQMRYTQQRWSMAKVIVENADHMTSQDILKKVKAKYPKIGNATIYRNIKFLCEAHILEESHQSKDGQILYELVHENHDHIVCEDCGEIFEFIEPKIENLHQGISEKMNFEIKETRQIIRAHCSLLKEKRKSK